MALCHTVPEILFIAAVVYELGAMCHQITLNSVANVMKLHTWWS